MAEDGRVLIDEFRSMGRDRRPLQTIRLLSAAGTSTVVHRSQRVYGEARFCGDRPVLHTFNRRARLNLRVLEPPAELFDGTLPERDTYASCDARHFVLVTVGVDPGELAYDFALPQ